MEEEQEKRGEEGGFEEAALRTRTTERPVCGGKAEREKGNTRRREDGERNRGRVRGGKGTRESETGETSQANFNANELLHWQIICGSHLALRFFSKSSSEKGTR